jgi:DNA repair photolyase
MVCGVPGSQLRWELADAPRAQEALFDESIFEREPGRGEFRGLEFLHVRTKRIINDVGAQTPYGFRYTINAYRGCSHACAYCLSGDTPILMGDGRVELLRDVRVGDEIFGTQIVGRYRRLARTIVLDKWATYKRAYRIRLIDGTELIASGDHRFLSNRGWKHVTGAEHGPDCRPHLTLDNELIGIGGFAMPPKVDDDYKRGYLCGANSSRVAPIDSECMGRMEEYLADLGDTGIGPVVSWPHEATASWTKGFLAGTFDAEGGLGQVIRISNSDPVILDRIMQGLDAIGLPCILEPPNPSGYRNVRITGGLVNVLRFIHTVDPAISRKRDIAGRAVKTKNHLRVVSIEDLGIEMPMYDITTGTGDFIADGVVSHNCFARPTHAYLDLNIAEDFDRKIVVKVNAAERLRAELHPRKWGGDSIAMGTNTDPYQRCEGKYHLTRQIIEVLNEFRNPFSILTKGTLILRDVDLLQDAAARSNVGVNLSIGTLDDDVWRLTEPGTPHPRQRMKAVEALNNAGIPCGVLMGPIIPGLSDRPEQIEEVVKAAQDAGARSISGVLLHLGKGTKEVFYDRIGEVHPELLPMYRRMYAERKYAPKVDRDRVSVTINRAAGRRQRDRPRSAWHPSQGPIQLNLL